MNAGLTASQQRAARIVGFAYLFAMAAAMLSEAYVRGTLIVAGDAAATARNILAHKALFRWGIGFEILTFVSDVALITALYMILGPIHRPLALFAACVRFVAAAVMVDMAAGSFDVLRILSGADEPRVFDSDQLAALAWLRLQSHGATYNVGFVLLGIGSAVFAYLWFRSRYVPRALAGLGIVASLLLGLGTFLILMLPGALGPFGQAYMAPMFCFEVGMGGLLLVRGLREPKAPAEA